MGTMIILSIRSTNLSGIRCLRFTSVNCRNILVISIIASTVSSPTTIRVMSTAPAIGLVAHAQNEIMGITQGGPFLRGKVVSGVRDINPIDDVGVRCATVATMATTTTTSPIARTALAPSAMLGLTINSINTMLLSSGLFDFKLSRAMNASNLLGKEGASANVILGVVLVDDSLSGKQFPSWHLMALSNFLTF